MDHGELCTASTPCIQHVTRWILGQPFEIGCITAIEDHVAHLCLAFLTEDA